MKMLSKQAEVEAANAGEEAELSTEPKPTESDRKNRRQEEARLSYYVAFALNDLYWEEDCFEDVSSKRSGGKWENVDVLGVHLREESTIETITVEAKLEFTAEAVQQGNNYRRFSDRVWIAICVDGDLNDAATELRNTDELLFDYVIELGIGILACKRGRGGSSSYTVAPVHWPKRNQPDNYERKLFHERYRDEFLHWGVLKEESPEREFR